MKQSINEIKRMQRIAGLITESEYQESLNEAYSNKRVNYRDEKTATPDVINHLFDTIDIVPLDNGNKLQITTTYYYRDPGVKGYDVNSLSEDNPDVSKVRAILLDPAGGKLSSKTFTDPFLIKTGKSFFIPQIVASFENK